MAVGSIALVGAGGAVGVQAGGNNPVPAAGSDPTAFAFGLSGGLAVERPKMKIVKAPMQSNTPDITPRTAIWDVEHRLLNI